jgi:apolipoprotein N-acyltransferase
MAVITNDAWWGNTPGHKQHFLYAKLRAIETRRTILRAANTGFSGIINEKGEVIYKTRYEERTAIRAIVYPNEKITFYVKYGDYIAYLGLSIFALFFIWVVYVSFSKKKSPEFLKKIRKKHSRITS